MTLTNRSRWLALYVLCLASLMIVLDVTIVNVALPSIKTGLGFSQSSLAWVVNAYLLTYGGFLLLAAASPTCSARGGCSSAESRCSRSPRSPAASPTRRGC